MIDTKLKALAPGEIHLGGYGAEIIEYITEEQLLDSGTWSLLVDQFRRCEDGINNGWRGEYWGKMMRGAALTYRATKNEKLYATLVDTVEDMLSTQDSLGRFSTYSQDTEFRSWDMWARKYVILGMAYFYDICKSNALKDKIKKALIRHADYIMAKVGEGEGKIGILDTSEHIGAMNSASILEAFVRMYTIIGDDRYLDYSGYIVSTGMCRGADLVVLCLKGDLYPYQFPVTKAYEMMSCFEGVLEYYKYTGNSEHLMAVESFVDMLVRTDITIIGGAGCKHEFLDNSAVTQTEPASDVVMQETCVTVTFMKLCAKLLLLTGKPKYAEYIEKSGLNAMYGAVNDEKQTMRRTVVRTWTEGGRMVMIDDHDSFPFDSYSPLYRDRRGKRCGGVQFIGEGRCYGCCVCIGSAGTAIMGLVPVLRSEEGFAVNMYSDCKVSTKVGDKRVRLSMRANPYESNGARISIDGKGAEFEISLRVPTWSEGFTVKVNGEEIVADTSDGYLHINRAWCKDRLTVSFRAPVKMRLINGKIAFTKGPIALAMDSRLTNINSHIDVRAKDGKSIRARRVSNDKFASNIAYEIEAGEEKVILTDYSRSGKNFDDNDSLVTVWQKIK